MSKVDKLRRKAAMGDPKAIAKLQYMYGPQGTGMLVARGIEGRGKCGGAMMARPAGGFIGALATAAMPLIVEGIKWIANKIQERKEKRAALGQGLKDGVWIDAANESEGDKPPRTASSFWRKVYKIASKEIPIHFRNRKRAQEEVDKFLAEHARAFFGVFRDKVLSDRRAAALKELSAAQVLEPVAESTAMELGIPVMEAEKMASAVQELKPMGEGFFDSLMEIITSPTVKSLVSEGAKKLIPAVADKIRSFAASRMTKFKAKHPKLGSVVEAAAPMAKTLIQGVIGAPTQVPSVSPTTASSTAGPTTASTASPDSASTAPATVSTSSAAVPAKEAAPVSTPIVAAAGIGPASADAFTRGGRMASRVYAMAKKTGGSRSIAAT